jgi:hypothetical protein
MNEGWSSCLIAASVEFTVQGFQVTCQRFIGNHCVFTLQTSLCRALVIIYADKKCLHFSIRHYIAALTRIILTRDTSNHFLWNATQRLSGAVGGGGAEDEEQEGTGRLGCFKRRFGQEVGAGEWTELQEGIEAGVEPPLSKKLPRRHECVGASSLLDPWGTFALE